MGAGGLNWGDGGPCVEALGRWWAVGGRGCEGLGDGLRGPSDGGGHGVGHLFAEAEPRGLGGEQQGGGCAPVLGEAKEDAQG